MTDEGAARPDAKIASLEALHDWSHDAGGHHSASEGEAFIDGFDAGAKYASSSNAALQFEFDDLFKQFNVIAAMARRYLVEIGELRDSRDRLQEALREIWSRLQADEIGEARILTMAALGDPERKG